MRNFNITPKEFWSIVATEGSAAEKTFISYWDRLTEDTLTQAEAVECLDALYIFTHKRILEHDKVLASHYPTKQFTPNRLEHEKHLWWVDHFTAGISVWSTLGWFSSAKRKNKVTGKLEYSRASTHFVQGYHGYPFYIIPLVHGAWHTPARNKDSISIEMVNAGGVTLNKKRGEWNYWAGVIPKKLVQELPPVLLDRAYNGNTAMQPFTKDQIISNIKLKRLVRTALGADKIEESRMSQHSDWQAGKSDMGKLWPFESCNDSAFMPDPIPELDFIQDYDKFMDDQGTIWEDPGVVEDNSKSPEYGTDTPTHDDDDDGTAKEIWSVQAVQNSLISQGLLASNNATGRLDAVTKEAIKAFQRRWNSKNPSKTNLLVDGIPGIKTCSRLKEER